MSGKFVRFLPVVAVLGVVATWYAPQQLSGQQVQSLQQIAGQYPAQPSTTSGEWPMYTADLRGSKYSPLDQINAGNFSKLEVAWRFKTDNLGPRPEIVGFEPPRDLELAEVARVDLIQRRVLAPPQVGRIHRPLSARRARLGRILAGYLLKALDLLARELLRGVPHRGTPQHGNDREEADECSGHAFIDSAQK